MIEIPYKRELISGLVGVAVGSIFFNGDMGEAIVILLGVMLLILFLFIAVINTNAIQTCIDNQAVLEDKFYRRKNQSLRKEDLLDIPEFLRRQAD